jgi:inositol transport system substrate-binding protein
MMKILARLTLATFLTAALLAACERVEESGTGSGSAAGKRSTADAAGTTETAAAPSGPMTIGVAFDTLQTQFWVAALDIFRAECRKRNIRMLEMVANNDVNTQMEQVRSLITQKVDGIIIAPKDKTSVIRMIKDANQAGVPIVCFNRPPAETKEPIRYAAVVADNFKITSATVAYMAAQARQSGKPCTAMILIGALDDENAIGRRDGFDAVARQNQDIIKVVSRVPTEWNQERAMNGVANALQANPDINFIFTSSDFLFPSIVSALEKAGKYKKIGQPGHVLLGGFDGDATAWKMLEDGYLDADGVQDVYFEAQAAIQAILDLKAGKDVPRNIFDPGFVIHQGNLKDVSSRMWGAQVKKK